MASTALMTCGGSEAIATGRRLARSISIELSSGVSSVRLSRLSSPSCSSSTWSAGRGAGGLPREARCTAGAGFWNATLTVRPLNSADRGAIETLPSVMANSPGFSAFSLRA